MQKRYVMFGHNNLLGDIIEILYVNGGILTKIVQNVPEPSHSRRPSLAERLSRLGSIQHDPRGVNHGVSVETCDLQEFVPEKGESYIIGFTGHKMDPLVRELEKKYNLNFSTITHSTAIISPTAVIANGGIINAGTIIASGVEIEEHVTINKGVIIGHDCRIERYSVIQPGVKIGGHVQVKTGAVLGIGAVFTEDLVVGEYSVVAAGAVVTTDVPPRTMVAGIPAVVKKQIKQDLDT